MAPELAALVPVTKFETEKASALVRLGFPAVEPVVPNLLEWLQDLNWPVGRVFQPFLMSIGRPLAPHIRIILAGHDDCWKFSVLSALINRSQDLAHALRPELERLARHPSAGESKEEVNLIAIQILEAIGGAAAEA